MRAIDLNGVAIEMNKRAFELGRVAAAEPDRIPAAARSVQSAVIALPRSLEQLIDQRFKALVEYQNLDYANRYRTIVERVRAAEQALGSSTELTRAVVRCLYKLMAYKDEYEVARMYVDPVFRRRIESTFEGEFRLRVNLAPPLLARKDSRGVPTKSEYGPWIWPAFRVLARLRLLRGTAFDPFGYTAERRAERALLERYIALVDRCIASLTRQNLSQAVEMANVPDSIRGFGHVKAASMKAALARWDSMESASVAPPLPASVGL